MQPTNLGSSTLECDRFSTLAHVVNVYHLALIYSSSTKGRVLAYFDMLFFVGPTATGWIMVGCLTAMIWTSLDKNKKKNFERFWYTHHLFIVFFINWQFHGMFCMIKVSASWIF